MLYEATSESIIKTRIENVKKEWSEYIMIKNIFVGIMLFSMMLALNNAEVCYASEKISFVTRKRDSNDYKGTSGIYGYLQVTNDPLMNQRFYAECWFVYKAEYSRKNTLERWRSTFAKEIQSRGDFWREYNSQEIKFSGSIGAIKVYNIKSGMEVYGNMGYVYSTK